MGISLQNNYFRKMIVLRILLFPFAVLYGFVTAVRNLLYDKGLLKSHSFDTPVIAVGNLSVGGTGKTPQIEYLIRLLSPHHKIATLSRGYKRKSKGFVMADPNATAGSLGDEPYQLHLKFPEVIVAVDADRKNGIERLLSLQNPPGVILLDDAFQHRKVKAGFYILLTAYGDLFCDDFMLPTGMLREGRSGAKRANLIVVTKCPVTITEEERQNITKKINLEIPVYFSCIQYDEKVYGENDSKWVSQMEFEEKLLLAGIAKPQPFFDYLKGKNDTQLVFADHHHFSQQDIEAIEQKADQRPIITTEKDYVRLKNAELKLLYYLPIKSHFVTDAKGFDAKILHFAARDKS